MKFTPYIALLIILQSSMLFGQKKLSVTGNSVKNDIRCVAYNAFNITMLTSSKTYIFQEFDLKGQSKGKITLTQKQLGKKSYVAGKGIYFNNKLVVAISTPIYGKSFNEIKLLEIDFKKSTHRFIDIGSNEVYIDQPYFKLVDEKLYLAYATPSLSFKVVLLDESLKATKKYEQKVRNDGYYLSMNSFHVYDTYIIMGGLFKQSVNVLTYFNTATNAKKTLFLKTQKHLAEMYYTPMANGDILATGLWSNKGNKFANGFCSIILEKNTLKVKDENYTVFSDNILNMHGLTKEQAKSGKGIKKEFRGDKPLIDNEGNMYVFYEVHYYTMSSSGNSTSFLEDIVIAKIDSTGKVLWQDIIILKNSYKDGGHFLSFNPVLIDNNLSIIYNDHQKNENVSKRKDLNNTAKMNFAELKTYKIDYNKDGDKTKSAFSEDNSKDFMYCPILFKQLNNKLFYIEKCSRPVLAGRTTGEFIIQEIE